MRRLRIAVIDILSKSASNGAYARAMRPITQSIMPQVVAVWCEELGHDVEMVFQDGPEVLAGHVQDDVDVVFISAYSTTSMIGYALSSYYRSKGAVTVLGGPHARSFPEDAVKYFDYVVGFCDKELLRDLLQDASQHRPEGQLLSAAGHPRDLPGLRQRWKFMESVIEHAWVYRPIHVIASLGCPYTCSFCIDSVVPHQPLDADSLKEDLRFLVERKQPRTLVGWMDPNFGVRMDDDLGMIEEAIPPGSLSFFAETSLSLLKEENVKRMARVGFRVLAPGVESWFDFGAKSARRSTQGMEKVRRLADQANMIVSHVPYLQTNLIFGLDGDEGDEPFELTKRFVDLAPGVMPYFSVLIASGRNSKDNLQFQREGRVIPIPYHYLNQIHASNVRPLHYGWPEFYARMADLYEYTYSWKAIARRLVAKRHWPTQLEQAMRCTTLERGHKLEHNRRMRDRLDTDPELLPFLNGETTALPQAFVRPIQRDLGWLWEWLPERAYEHDPNAYLAATERAKAPAQALPLVQVAG